jgi:hypothetical protein
VREGDQNAINAFDVQVSELESALFDKIEGRGAKPGRPKGPRAKPIGYFERKALKYAALDKARDYTGGKPDAASGMFDKVKD